MGRVLAIDYGTKRTGIAVSDPLRMIANGLDTVPTDNLLDYLGDYFDREEVETVVIGEPKRFSGVSSKVEDEITGFVRKLSKRFPDLTIDRADERFTSKIAFQTMVQGGMKKKDRQNKAMVDKISAVIILQDYLDR